MKRFIKYFIVINGLLIAYYIIFPSSEVSDKALKVETPAISKEVTKTNLNSNGVKDDKPEKRNKPAKIKRKINDADFLLGTWKSDKSEITFKAFSEKNINTRIRVKWDRIKNFNDFELYLNKSFTAGSWYFCDSGRGGGCPAYVTLTYNEFNSTLILEYPKNLKDGDNYYSETFRFVNSNPH